MLLLDDLTGGRTDLQLHSICHGVIALERLTMEFGADAAPHRGAEDARLGLPEGWHDYVIRPGGLDVFPRLVAAAPSRAIS